MAKKSPAKYLMKNRYLLITIVSSILFVASFAYNIYQYFNPNLNRIESLAREPSVLQNAGKEYQTLLKTMTKVEAQKKLVDWINTNSGGKAVASSDGDRLVYGYDNPVPNSGSGAQSWDSINEDFGQDITYSLR